uniref:hypothetical protein n=1 Tax=Streptomyces sp. NBC_01001 TaxID=2903713 RepID=UPI002F90740B
MVTSVAIAVLAAGTTACRRCRSPRAPSGRNAVNRTDISREPSGLAATRPGLRRKPDSIWAVPAAARGLLSPADQGEIVGVTGIVPAITVATTTSSPCASSAPCDT